jgi:hypothetical protein
MGGGPDRAATHPLFRLVIESDRCTGRIALDRYVAGSRGEPTQRCEALRPRDATRVIFEEILSRPMSYPDHKVRLLVNSALEIAPHDSELRESKEKQGITMKDSELDRILRTAARRPIEVSPAVLERIARSLRTSIEPVRPLPPTWVLTSRLLAMYSMIAVAGAVLSGFDAIGGLNPKGRIAILVTLAILGYTTGRELVSQFIPGSRHFVAPRVLVATIVALLFSVSAFLLRNYRTDHLITAGVTCLTTGLICAAPAGLISAWILRRGFAVNPVSAGLVLGILSGIAGVAMLELHCANFQPLHLLWHLLVVLVAGIVGALVGQWVFGRG